MRVFLPPLSSVWVEASRAPIGLETRNSARLGDKGVVLQTGSGERFPEEPDPGPAGDTRPSLRGGGGDWESFGSLTPRGGEEEEEEASLVL